MRNRPGDAWPYRGVTSRRTVLQAGASGLLGIGLSGLLAGSTRAAGRPREARSVLIIFLTGGPSHVDTFDMKPEAPLGFRGDFQPIATAVPGVQVCEHLPGLAQRLDRLAVVRSMRSPREFVGHHHATHAFLTGIDRLPAGMLERPSRHDWPHYAAGLDYCRPRTDGLPSGVLLPRLVGDGTLGTYSGQSAGFLGPRHDPWLLSVDPTGAGASDSVAVPAGLSLGRMRSRKELLNDLDRQRAALAQAGAHGRFTAHQDQAFRVLTSTRLPEALNLDREPAALRDRYGRHLFGQSLLLARRLVEAGVRVVQANLAEYYAQWDTHTDNCATLKKTLLSPLDRAVSALLDDMAATGLLDETLVLLTGEFGRTPRLGGFVNTPSFNPTGRDHWLDCFTSVFAGGGVREGQVIGASDKVGAFATTRTYSLPDLGATVYTALGVDPATPISDAQGRSYRLNEGEPIAALYT